jgi:cytochrome b pre-mRNA-processing protein 3
MILRLFRHTPRDDRIAGLYGTIVAQAREPAFYRGYGVPDTVNGRFEMIMLHLILVLGRLAAEPEPTRRLGQALFDHFCRDMDDSLREMGVGDLAVPRQMRRVGEAFYGRKATYEAALAATDDGTLTDALARIVYAGRTETPVDAQRLAAYVRAASHHLARQDATACSGATLDFPAPEPSRCGRGL